MGKIARMGGCACLPAPARPAKSRLPGGFSAPQAGEKLDFGTFFGHGPFEFPAIRRYVTTMTNKSPMTGAERQRRWRDRRNALIEALTGSPTKAAAAIVGEIGVDRARDLGRILVDGAVKQSKRKRTPSKKEGE
jgi:hypothetical protein